MRAVVLVLAAVGVLCAQTFFAPALVYKVNPQYTMEAWQAGIEGAVVLYVVVGTDGRAHRIRVVKSLGYGLDRKAIECVRQWRFRPAEKDGVAVPTRASIEVSFRLRGAGSDGPPSGRRVKV